MILWLVVGVLLLAVMLALLAPLVRQPSPTVDRSEHGFEVLRDQLAEVERDRAAGRLDADSAYAARLEIERQLLAAAEIRDAAAGRSGESVDAGRRRRLIAAVLVLLVVPVGSIGLYMQRGEPGLPDAPLASR